MIGYIQGRPVRSSGDTILVLVQGIGYELHCSKSTVESLDGKTFVELWVHTHVREDALVLYGFATRDERVCFEVLLGAHGVGPALALAILSAHSPTSLRTAVATDDSAALTSVAGVGAKTAARLLIELKSRFEGADFDADRVGIDAGRPGATSVDVKGASDPRGDVRDALTGLGYGSEEIRATLRRLPTDGEAAVLLKQALSILAGVSK